MTISTKLKTLTANYEAALAAYRKAGDIGDPIAFTGAAIEEIEDAGYSIEHHPVTGVSVGNSAEGWIETGF